MVPFLLEGMLRLLSTRHAHVQQWLPSVRYFMSGGAKLTPAMIDLAGRVGARLHSHYGQTEACCFPKPSIVLVCGMAEIAKLMYARRLGGWCGDDGNGRTDS